MQLIHTQLYMHLYKTLCIIILLKYIPYMRLFIDFEFRYNFINIIYSYKMIVFENMIFYKVLSEITTC